MKSKTIRFNPSIKVEALDKQDESSLSGGKIDDQVLTLKLPSSSDHQSSKEKDSSARSTS